MAGALFSRLKNWIEEVLTYADLNAEIDNILNNFLPAMMDDYSLNQAQMQSTADPGESGSESLATSLAGELQRLRFAIAEMKGTTYWYETAGASLNGLDDLIANDTPRNRIQSGATVSATNTMPVFLDPDGSARTLVIDATPTNLVYFINGTQYTVSTDTTLSSLLAAPSTNNTALVNDAALLGDPERSRLLGENGTTIPIDNIGSEITSLNGKIAAFSISNSPDTEYIIARVDTTNSVLKDVRRGYFFNTSQAAIPRITFSDNDVITLMKLTWVYANTAGTFVVSYTNPTYSGDEPSSPATGDYWFDITNDTWKIFDSANWVTANVIPIGVCIQNTTATVAARSFDLFKTWSDVCNIDIERVSNTSVQGRSIGRQIDINGTRIRFQNHYPIWDITANLESGVVEAASTLYYLYMDEFGDEFISNIAPYDRRSDLMGFYHPHRMWRMIGTVFNNASSNFAVDTFAIGEGINSNNYTFVSAATYQASIQDDVIACNSDSNAITVYLPSAVFNPGKRFTIQYVGTGYANAVTISQVNAANFNISVPNEAVTVRSDGTVYRVVNRNSTIYLGTITTTGSWSTNTTYTAQYWKIGDSLEGLVKIATAGAPNNASLTITLPNSWQVNTSKLYFDTANNSNYVGQSNIRDDSASNNYLGPVNVDSTAPTLIQPRYEDDGANGVLVQAISSNTLPMTWATADSLICRFKVPINGWN